MDHVCTVFSIKFYISIFNFTYDSLSLVIFILSPPLFDIQTLKSQNLMRQADKIHNFPLYRVIQGSNSAEVL